MNDFPVYPQNPVKKAAKKPNAFFHFFGHPLWTVLTLIALFFYCALMTPIFDTFWVLYLFLFPLFFIFFALCMVGAFGCRRYILAGISIIVFLTTLVFSFRISNGYDMLRFYILEDEMCETAEEILAELPPFTERDSFWISLPASKSHLSRGGSVYVEGVPNERGGISATVAFVRFSGIPDGSSYYVYKSKSTGGWHNVSFAVRHEILNDNFCLITD